MTERGKQPGNIGELLTMGMCVLALTVVMLNYLQNVQLLQAKENVGQLARAYLLKMETRKRTGFLGAGIVSDTVSGNFVVYAAATGNVQGIRTVSGRCIGTVQSGIGSH